MITAAAGNAPAATRAAQRQQNAAKYSKEQMQNEKEEPCGH